MSEPITIEDIYKLFQISQQEADRRFAEIATAEVNRAAADEKRSVEAKQRSVELDKRLSDIAAADEQRWAKREISLAMLERIAAQTSKEVSALSSRWGRFIENFVEPGVIALFQSRGIEVTETHMRNKSHKNGLAMEIDILVTNSNVAVLVEVKSRLKRDDVTKFIAKIPKFKSAFPNYKNFQVYGAIAAIEFDEHTDTFAYEQGLFIIKQSGKTVILSNDENFKPLVW